MTYHTVEYPSRLKPDGVMPPIMCVAGVVWFGRLCAALGVDPPSCFRSWLAALGPELLKGPFNHEERQQVGMLACGYTLVTHWQP